MEASEIDTQAVDHMVEQFLDRKDTLNQKAHRHRDLRDRLNDQTKSWANTRDELNGKVRGLIDQANGHKSKRDELNGKVQEAKERRDELNKVANERAEALNELKKDRMPRDGMSVGKLKHRLRQLEFEQMTRAVSPKKEKELIEQMQALQREIEAKEKAYEEDTQVKEAYEAMKAAKADAEAQHRAVTELANAAQSEHDAMVNLFEEADKYRKEADGAQEKFVASKVEADKVHHEYIEMVNQIRDFEKVVGGMRTKERRARGAAAHASAKADAEAVFDKLKKGEKLSTEDLMVLQKAGLR